MQVIAGSSSFDLAHEISELKSWDLLIPYYKEFSDGETYIRFDKEVESEVLIIQSLYRPQEVHLFQLLNLIATARRLGAKTVHVFTPYFCYARADRVVLPGDAVSAATVLQLLESVGTDHLITLDLHNHAIKKYTNMKFTNIIPVMALKNYFTNLNLEEFQIIAPDQGAKERANLYADALNLPVANLTKFRDPNTGEVNVIIGDAEIIRQKVILIDDIMATGSSLVESASLLKFYDVSTIYIFVSHALGTTNVDRLREIGNAEVVATTSIPSVIGKISPALDLVSLF